MGNCWERCAGRCFGRIDRRKYLRTRYSVERDFSIEFENLMEDETQDDLQKPLTDREKQLLTAKKYDAIVHEQKRLDDEIEYKLAKQEEELRQEEEAYYEAKREASRLSRLQRTKEQAAKPKLAVGAGQGWPDSQDSEWEIAGAEDDFEMFLASVKARSISTRSKQRRGSADGQSTSSSTTQTKDRSHTEASSIDLEWEHEAGMVPQQKRRSGTEENLSSIASKQYSESPNNSNDLEWDNDFVSSDTIETEQLLGKSTDKPQKTGNNGNKLHLAQR